MATGKDATYDSETGHPGNRVRPEGSDWQDHAETIQSPSEWGYGMVQAVKDHPWSTLTLSLGVGWLVYESTLGIGPRRRVRKVSRSVKRTMKSGRSAARRTWRSLRRGTVETAEAVQGTATEAAAQARDRAAGAARGLRSFVCERPLVAGLATLGAGVLVGVCLPSTRAEDGWMGRTRDEVLKGAERDAAEVAEKGKDIARTAVRHFSQDTEAEGQRVASSVHAADRRTREESFRRDPSPHSDRPDSESFLDG